MAALRPLRNVPLITPKPPGIIARGVGSVTDEAPPERAAVTRKHTKLSVGLRSDARDIVPPAVPSGCMARRPIVQLGIQMTSSLVRGDRLPTTIAFRLSYKLAIGEA